MDVTCARAIYDYEAQADDQLSMTKGAVMILVEALESGWSKVQIGNDSGLVPHNYLELLSAEEVQQIIGAEESAKPKKANNSKNDLKNEMKRLKQEELEKLAELDALKEEVQELTKARKDLFRNTKAEVEEIGSEYFRISPLSQLMYFVTEIITSLDAETDAQKEIEIIQLSAIQNTSIFTDTVLSDKSLKHHVESISPLIGEIQTKLINQRANSDLFTSDFFDILLVLADSITHLLAGGELDDLHALFENSDDDPDALGSPPGLPPPPTPENNAIKKLKKSKKREGGSIRRSKKSEKRKSQPRIKSTELVETLDFNTNDPSDRKKSPKKSPREDKTPRDEKKKSSKREKKHKRDKSGEVEQPVETPPPNTLEVKKEKGLKKTKKGGKKRKLSVEIAPEESSEDSLA